MPSGGGAKARKPGLIRRLASPASDSKPIPGSPRCRTSGLLWRWSLRDVSMRPSARRSVANVCDARRSPPSVTRTPCSCSRRSVSLDRGWRAPPATSGVLNAQSRNSAIRDGWLQSQPGSSGTSWRPGRTTRNATSSSSRARPSLPCCGASQTGLSRREIGDRLYISLNTVKSHTRELYRKLAATSRNDAVGRAEALGLLNTPDPPGDPRPEGPKPQQYAGMLRSRCRRTATASLSPALADGAPI